MRRTFPRRWVSARPSRLCAVKVTPPPENGRLARENKGAERSPASTPRDSLSFGLNSLRSCSLLISEPTGERNHGYSVRKVSKSGVPVAVFAMADQAIDLVLRECFRSQVEERDSGTESDDEAERADTGECLWLADRSLSKPGPARPGQLQLYLL